MATTRYITPIYDRTSADVDFARDNQQDLENKHKGAWNYTDANRVCNNLKYAAEHMYREGFLSEPYVMSVKTDWTEDDIITYEEINTMIVNNMNNLRTYSRPDLQWFPIALIANMDFNVANWLERNIDELAHQVPMPPEKFTLTVEYGSGSGEYEANTIVEIVADPPPEEGLIFDHWSGDHLENIEHATAAHTTYKMPYMNINLKANYSNAVPHTLTVKTYTNTITEQLMMGGVLKIEADPAPLGKVFHHWEVSPAEYEDQLYEPAASTHFTMPNADVTLTAVYITVGDKYLSVVNGTGSGWYTYGTNVQISPTIPSGSTFTGWSGDTQYLTGDTSTAYNVVKIPDVSRITVRANYHTPSSGGGSNPGGGGGGSTYIPATDLTLTVKNGFITSTGGTTGVYDEFDRVAITADPAPSGYVFDYWSRSGDGSVSGSANGTVVIGRTDITVTAVYRRLEYYTLRVTTDGGTTTTIKESEDRFSIDARPIPSGYVFEYWSGDTSGISTREPYNGNVMMGHSDRTITAIYRYLDTHTLTVNQLSGSYTYIQKEGSTVTITPEAALPGTRFTHWTFEGAGHYSVSNGVATVTYGNGDATLTAHYVNIWTITAVNGTINNRTSAVLDEGSTYSLVTRDLAIYEGFDGWSQSGPGSIRNAASKATEFTVGNGDATLTANISQYPDKTLKVYWRHPSTNVTTLAFEKTYQYGSKIPLIEAQIAPDKSTFLSWLGDVDDLKPSALASTVSIDSITTDTAITATYFYPESPQYFTLTVYDGYPESGTYAAGTQVAINARTPSQNWEFHKWEGDTQYLVDPNVKLPENSVIMPLKSITLKAKFKVLGEEPLYRCSVSNGTASATYKIAEDSTVDVSGVYIDVPADTEVTLTGEPDVVGWVFDRWDGNFEAAGVIDIVKTNNPTVFTMPENDVNVVMIRRELMKATVYTTNATGPGNAYAGKYPIAGTLRDTEDIRYVFSHWTCVDADGIDCISAIEDPEAVETNINLGEKDLWIEAVYKIYYKLTVVEGQDTGEGYYEEGFEVTTVYANTPAPEEKLVFDHWEDPMMVLVNIYDPTPTIIMRNTVATITAVFISLDAQGNSVVVTSEDIDDSLITRSDSYAVNGTYNVGTLAFDKEGCLGVVTEVDPDKSDDTDDFAVEQLFYGGNF